MVERESKSGNVTIYLPGAVLDRCRRAAAEDKRSLSNYLAGLLERAHPAAVHASRQIDIEEITGTSAKQAQHRKNMAARQQRLEARMAKQK